MTVPAVPPKIALSNVTALHGTYVVPSNHLALVVFHVPAPPVPAAAPFGSHVRFVCAKAGAPTAKQDQHSHTCKSQVDRLLARLQVDFTVIY